MCGRYAMDQDVDVLIGAYLADGGQAKDFVAAWQANFSIAPTDRVPFVWERFVDDQQHGERELGLAAWDFRPAWRKEPRPLINARLETVAQLPTFRRAFTARRALLPMSGYYEWTGTKGNKTPHYIHAGGELLSAAGLYEWCSNDAGDWQVSTVVITRTGVDSAGDVHDRMPVFLTPDTWDEWLDPNQLAPAAKPGVLAMLDYASTAVAASLSTHRVDRRVNDIRAIDQADASLIEPVETHGE